MSSTVTFSKSLTLRVPYPLGFYTKGFDGRIDDIDAGWKGRGLWVSGGDRTPWLMEGGKENKPLVALPGEAESAGKVSSERARAASAETHVKK